MSEAAVDVEPDRSGGRSFRTEVLYRHADRGRALGVTGDREVCERKVRIHHGERGRSRIVFGCALAKGILGINFGRDPIAPAGKDFVQDEHDLRGLPRRDSWEKPFGRSISGDAYRNPRRCVHTAHVFHSHGDRATATGIRNVGPHRENTKIGDRKGEVRAPTVVFAVAFADGVRVVGLDE